MPFPLTTEPWIPCRRLDGSSRELGFIDVLVNAHELEAVRDASPMVTLGLHRLLLAILHRVFGPNDLATWRSMYSSGRFEADRVQSYLTGQRERLDLTHPERPFFQVRGLTKLYEPDGLGRLMLERSNYGAAVNVFQHRPRAEAAAEAIPLAVAARNLVALQGFAPGGLVRKKDEPGSASAAPLNRGAFVLVQGKSLFETLMLNLLVYAPDRGAPIPGRARDDVPSWEGTPLPRPLGSKESIRKPRGWVDLLTWQSRRVELEVHDGSRVTGIVYCVAQGLDREGLTDPMLPYRVGETGIVAIDLSEDRAVWRDCHALLRRGGADGAKPPMAVSQIAKFELRSILGSRPTFVLDVLGMRGDQAAIKLARHERISLPSAILADDERVAQVGQATSALDAVARRLTYATRDAIELALAPGGRKPDKEDVRRVADAVGIERVFWGRMAAPFEVFLDELAREPVDVAFERLASKVRREARDCLRVSTDALGRGSANLHGAAIAERRLNAGLHELLPDRAPVSSVPRGAS
jgi:CRISPR system Cascade subunit CasA